jgi:hypothetical protein
MSKWIVVGSQLLYSWIVSWFTPPAFILHPLAQAVTQDPDSEVGDGTWKDPNQWRRCIHATVMRYSDNYHQVYSFGWSKWKRALGVGWVKGLNNQYVHSLGCCAPTIGSKISSYLHLPSISACDALHTNSTSLKFKGIQRVHTDDVRVSPYVSCPALPTPHP